VKLGEFEGWLVLGDAHFKEQYDLLHAAVERKKLKDPERFDSSNVAKRYRMVTLLISEIVPADPSAIQFRLGKTLRSEYKHWRRAKFFQQYRLFFRYDSKSKIIIFSWFNDEETKRAYESKDDAYLVFEKMLDSGNPPNNWIELLDETKTQ
jgi:toxin YhaV